MNAREWWLKVLLKKSTQPNFVAKQFIFVAGDAVRSQVPQDQVIIGSFKNMWLHNRGAAARVGITTCYNAREKKN